MVDFGALFGDFGALVVGFGVLFGGFGRPLTQRPKAQPGTPSRLRPGWGGLRLTRFRGPKALCRQPKVDDKGSNAMCNGLSAKYTKTKGKP